MAPHTNSAARSSTFGGRKSCSLLLTIAIHLTVTCILFPPIYCLTFYTSGKHYRTIHNIARSSRAGLPAVNPKSGRDRDLEHIRIEVASACQTVFRGSLAVCLVSVAAYQRVPPQNQLLLLVVVLFAAQGVYYSYAINGFVESVTKLGPDGLPHIHHWSLRQRKMASTLMAIPNAFTLAYFFLGVLGVLCYFDSALAVPLLDFLFSIADRFRDVLHQVPPIVESDASTTAPALDGSTIVGFTVVAIIMVGITQCVVSSLDKVEGEDDIGQEALQVIFTSATPSTSPGTPRRRASGS